MPPVHPVQIYFLVLLLHRDRRDDHACRLKYGKDWDKFCSIVRYRMFPLLYVSTGGSLGSGAAAALRRLSQRCQPECCEQRCMPDNLLWSARCSDGSLCFDAPTLATARGCISTTTLNPANLFHPREHIPFAALAFAVCRVQCFGCCFFCSLSCQILG